MHVARAFTTHQHHTLVEQVGRWLRDSHDSPFGGPVTDRPAVVVAPALDALYRNGDLRSHEAEQVLTRSLAVLTEIARDQDIPVLVTRMRGDADLAPIEAAATTIGIEETQFGPRFECDGLDFETLVYHVEDGIVQTTISYWTEILRARHPSVATGTDVMAPTAASATIGSGDIR